MFYLHPNLSIFITKALVDNDSNSHLVSVSCSVLVNRLKFTREYIENFCGATLQMIPRLHLFSIDLFFNQIFEKGVKIFEPVHRMLINFGFFDILMTDAENINISNRNAYLDENCLRYIGICNILFNASNFNLTRQELINQRTINFFIKNINSYPKALENARWRAILGLYTESGSFLFEPLFFISLAIFNEKTMGFGGYRVYCLSFITKMIQDNHSFLTHLVNTSFDQTLISVLTDYSNNTFIIQEIRSFLSFVFNSPVTMEHYLNTFAPFLLCKINDTRPCALTTFLFELVKFFLVKAREDSNFLAILENHHPSYLNVISDYIADRDAILRVDFGY